MIDICLIGRRYEDTIVHIDELNLGETNECVKVETRKGGMYNIQSANLDGLTTTCFPVGSKKALILGEQSGSRRTSIVKNADPHLDTLNGIVPTAFDWIHVSYLDDLKDDHGLSLKSAKSPLSVDFCTTSDREQYREIIDKCELVFDSRERKRLYSKIITPTPIVLHDEGGCECIQMGKVVSNSTIKPVSGLNVNGAGDIFAAIFIREFMSSGLDYAVETTSHLVTNMLKSRS